MTSAYAAPTLFFRPASLEDLDAIHALEVREAHASPCIVVLCNANAVSRRRGGLLELHGGLAHPALSAHCMAPNPARCLPRPSPPAPITATTSMNAMQSCSYPEDEAASREKLEYRIQHGGRAE